MLRPFRVLANVVGECARASRCTSGPRAFIRYATDIVLYRVLRVWRSLPGRDHERTIRLKGGLVVTYRLNRGDIQTLREVWLEECYRPPLDVPISTFVDLGANIGLVSLWYSHTYGARPLVCVEPLSENARLASRNLAANGVETEVLTAAVGPEDGTTAFRRDDDAQLGRVGEGDLEVPTVSMRTLLDDLPEGALVDLVKMDIEGSEGPLLSGDPDWLARVRALIVEFHPAQVDSRSLIELLRGRGFRYVPAGAGHRASMDFFVREELT